MPQRKPHRRRDHASPKLPHEIRDQRAYNPSERDDLAAIRREPAIVEQRHYLVDEVSPGLHFVFQSNGDIVNVAAVFHGDDGRADAEFLVTKMNTLEDNVVKYNPGMVVGA